jgi:hypothetical protein
MLAVETFHLPRKRCIDEYLGCTRLLSPTARFRPSAFFLDVDHNFVLCLLTFHVYEVLLWQMFMKGSSHIQDYQLHFINTMLCPV